MSKQLLKSTATVGGMTFISRILGFIRDMIAAHFFGASEGYDAFIVASKIPNFMRRLFAEGAFSQAFVPLLSEYRTQKSPLEVQQFISRVFGCLGLVLMVVTVLGIVGSSGLVKIFAPGFESGGDHSRLLLASHLLKITFPYLLLISLTAFAGGILNCYGRFAIPALTPVFLNITMILATLCLAPYLAVPITALAWGILGGGIIQLLFQIPFLKQLKLFPSFTVDWSDPGVRRILTLMMPALLGVSVNQLNLMLSSVFASFLPVGSVSWLYYAERLMEFPLGGFGVALATVVLPKLSRHHAQVQTVDFSYTLDWGIRWVMIVGLPAALGLALLAGPLLTTLFQSGRFSEHDVLSSQSCLVAYTVGIMGFMLVKILASAYYAKQDVKTPVKIALGTVVANAVFSAAFLLPWAHTGLALATSLAAVLNALFLGRGLIQKQIYQVQPGWGRLFIQLSLALSAMAFILLWLTPVLSAWFSMNKWTQVLYLIGLVVAAFLAYAATLLICGLRPRHLLIKP